jgi:hypothetical protein
MTCHSKANRNRSAGGPARPPARKEIYMSAFIERFDFNVVSKPNGKYILYSCFERELFSAATQIKNLEHQVGELEDQVFELTRLLAGKE